MYFEAYLRGRNGPPPIQVQNIPQGYSQPIKTPLPRCPPTQTNFVFNKQLPIFNQSRVDTNRPNSSVNVCMNDFRKVGHQQKSPIGAVNTNRTDQFTNNYVTFNKNRFPIAEEQKYICLSPHKNSTFRTSAGCGDNISPFRIEHSRNSQTIPNHSETLRQSVVNLSGYPQRRTMEYLPAQTKINNITTENYFANNPSVSQTRNKVLKKQSVDTVLYGGYRQENKDLMKQPFTMRKSSMNDGFDTINKLNQTLQFDVEKRRSDYKTYDYSKNSTIQNATTPQLKRELSQDYLNKYSISKLPDLDRTLDKDIESLKFTSKKTNQIIDQELNKNNYLNQLFEHKGMKNDEKVCQMKDKKELAAKNILFQRQIQEKIKELTQKNRELLQKNKQLSEKSKTIIEKNKQIEQLASEIKVLKQMKQENTDTTNQYQKQKQQLKQLKQKIKYFQGAIIEKDKIIQLNNLKIDNYNIKIIALEKNTLLVQQQHKNYEHNIKQLQNFKINQLSQQYDLTKEIDILKKEKETLELHNNKLNRDGKDLQIENQNLKNVNIHVQTINQKLLIDNSILLRELNESKIQKEHLKNQISSLTKIGKQLSDQHRQKIRIIIQQSNANNKAFSKIFEQKKSLQADLISVKQELALIKQEKAVQKSEIQRGNSYLRDLQQKYNQIGSLLPSGQNNTHQKLVNKIKECIEKFVKNDISNKDTQKNSYELLERKYQELSRQLKKVGNRLTCVAIQAQQGWHILKELNQQIIAINLRHLNEKYHQIAENF